LAKRKRIVAETDNSDWKAPKKRKPRKRMSEEQRVAAAARLEKAREKRKAKDPDYGMSSIHESLRNLPNDHPLHPNKVKQWIKSQKDLASSARSSIRQKVKGAEAQLGVHEGYVRNMQRYLRDGDWIDMFYGERLGTSHWAVPGPDGDFGYGGHCFPKDVKALIKVAQDLDIVPTILKATDDKNFYVRTDRDWENMKGRAVI